MNRRPLWSRVMTGGLATVAGLVAAAGTLIVATAAFVLSFHAIKDVAAWSHIDTGLAWLYPLAVDGAIATATVAVVVLHRLGRRTTYPWLVVLTGAAFSITCNALHAWAAGGTIALPVPVRMGVSSVPPALLGLSIHLLVIQVDAAIHRLSTGPDTTDPATGNDTLHPDRHTDLPVDLLRRIPVNDDPYQRWRDAWDDLRNGANPADVAAHHGYELRSIQFIRAAGQAGLLDSPIPPVRRLATTLTSEGHNDQTNRHDPHPGGPSSDATPPDTH